MCKKLHDCKRTLARLPSVDLLIVFLSQSDKLVRVFKGNALDISLLFVSVIYLFFHVTDTISV